MGYPDIRKFKKRNKSPEGSIQLQILKYCKLKGYVIGKTKTMGVYQKGRYRADPYVFRGFPDLTCFTPELIFIEVKSPIGRLSDAQKLFQETCKKANIRHVVARSLEDIQKII